MCLFLTGDQKLPKVGAVSDPFLFSQGQEKVVAPDSELN